MASTIIHTSIHLQPDDKPATRHGGESIWVEVARTVGVFPATADQADAIALAFTEAAQLLRERQQ